MTPIFVGNIKQGKLQLDLQNSFDRWLNTLEGKRVTVSVKRFRKDRSSQQLRYYWAVPVRLLSQQTGYEESEIHAILKYKFLRAINKDGYEYIKSLSTIAKQVDTSEMNEYIEKIQRWAAQDLQVFIPDPE